jgi:hypothetical protein
MAKKPPNAGILFERALIKLAKKAGMVALKLSTPTPPPMPCPRCHTPVRTSRFTSTRPFDVLMTVAATENHLFRVIALECKSSGKSLRLELDKIQEHQVSGLLDYHSKGWITGLAIDLPRPKSEDREWWFVPAPTIEQLFAICAAKGRKSLTFVELLESRSIQMWQDSALFSDSFGV